MILFQETHLLWLLVILLPGLALLFLQTRRARRKLLSRFASASLLSALTRSFSPFRENLKTILILLSFVLLVLSLARPQWGYEWREARGKGIDILFVLDASKSMLAQDIRPNRLERAKLAILDLIQDISGDRLGLIAFSGNAFLQCPLTLDHDAFRQSLDIIEPGLLSRGGTNFSSAIEEAAATFEEDNNFKFVVLLTDGEDLAGEGLAEAQKAAQQGIKIFTVGVGSSQGERIPVFDNRGRPTFLRDDRGNFVLTRLDEETLREVAEATGGFYTPLGIAGEGLQAVLNRGLASVPREELDSRLERIPVERFQVFLLLALLLLIADSLIGNRRRRRANPAVPEALQRSSQTLLLFLVGLAPLLFPPNLAADGNLQASNLYSEGNYEEAARLFRELAEKDPQNRLHRYNLGCANFRQGDWDSAGASFRQALETDDLNLQADAFYNLGNTRFRLGQETRESNPSATIESWEEALRDYENTLELRPGDSNAAYNYEVLRQLLEELKRQQEQQQQQQQQEGDNQQDRENQPQQESGSEQDRPSDSREGENARNQSEGSRRDPADSSPEREPQRDSGRGEEESPNPRSGERPPPSEREITGTDESPDTATPSGGDSGATAAMPLQMNRKEAEQLLEALRQTERKLPVTGVGEENDQRQPADFKDW